MGWETRGTGKYYYRKRRKGQRVVSEYVPSSIAMLIEGLDAEKRNERERLRQRERIERERLRAVNQVVDEVGECARLIIERTLIDSGFHRHKGQWRKKRNGRKEPDTGQQDRAAS
jgi:hypothetical protein